MNERTEMNESGCIEVSLVLDLLGDLTQLKSVRISFAAIYLVIFTFGLFGNGTLLITILSRRSLHSVANFFVANVAVSDILLCNTAIPYSPITKLFTGKNWYFGSFLCKFIPYAQGSSVLVSSLGLSGIAVDRYRNIVQTHKEPWNLNQAFCIIGCLWVVAGIANVPLFLSQKVRVLYLDPNKTMKFCGEFCGEYSWGSSVSRKIFGSTMVKGQFLVPLVTLSFCYWRILQVIHRDMFVAQLTGIQQLRAAKRKQRVTLVLVLMVVAFILSWLPLSVVNIARDFDISIDFFGQEVFGQTLTHSFAMTSVIWNPILYFWMSKANRMSIKEDFFSVARAVACVQHNDTLHIYGNQLPLHRRSSLPLEHRSKFELVLVEKRTRSIDHKSCVMLSSSSGCML